MTRLDDYLLEADQRGRRFSGAYTGTSGTLAGYVVTLVKLVRALLGQGLSESQREELIRMGFEESRACGPSGPPGYWESRGSGDAPIVPVRQIGGMTAIQVEMAWNAAKARDIARAESQEANGVQEGGGRDGSAAGHAENPKDTVGAGKLPMHLWPAVATAEGCVALLNGQLKYGRNNFRVTPVRATIYADALARHMARWMDGEECDEDGISHIGSALACLAIIADARAAGTLIDDRNYPGGVRRRIDELTPLVGQLRAAAAASAERRDWTIADSPHGR